MIRSKTSEWFECKVRYEKTMEDGMQRKVTEQYVVDALSWGEAESRITEEMSSYISVEFDIQDISRAAYKEIFFDDRDSADKYYKCKVAFITIDEKTQREKRAAVYYLVQAANIDNAKANIDEAMALTMIDYEVLAVVETKTMDVFEYTPKSEESEDEDSMDETAKESLAKHMLGDKKILKAAKALRDGVPDGMKVSLTHVGSDGSVHTAVIADKTHKDRKEIPKDE